MEHGADVMVADNDGNLPFFAQAGNECGNETHLRLTVAAVQGLFECAMESSLKI